MITNYSSLLLLVYHGSALSFCSTNVMLCFSFAVTMLCFNSTNRKIKLTIHNTELLTSVHSSSRFAIVDRFIIGSPLIVLYVLCLSLCNNIIIFTCRISNLQNAHDSVSVISIAFSLCSRN